MKQFIKQLIEYLNSYEDDYTFIQRVLAENQLKEIK
jgi:hypothetical protein